MRILTTMVLLYRYNNNVVIFFSLAGIQGKQIVWEIRKEVT
jgi:hypothetical protein